MEKETKEKAKKEPKKRKGKTVWEKERMKREEDGVWRHLGEYRG